MENNTEYMPKGTAIIMNSSADRHYTVTRQGSEGFVVESKDYKSNIQFNKITGHARSDDPLIFWIWNHTFDAIQRSFLDL